ncbi:MAG: hypothetical protein ACOC8Q_01520 [Desulfosalsimonas sp.]
MGDNGSPKTLEGIEFLGHEIRECSFNVHVDPIKKQQGYINHNVNFTFEYKENKTFFLYAGLKTDAYIGDAEKQDPENDEKVFTLNLNILLKYSSQKATGSPSQIKRYEWHFKSQAMLLLHHVSRDILKDTRFRVIDKALSFPL